MGWAIIVAAVVLYLTSGLWTAVFLGVGGWIAVAGAYELGRRSREREIIEAYHKGKARADEWWEEHVRVRYGYQEHPAPPPRPQRKSRPKVAPHWKLLGLKPWAATREDIAAAYRRLAMKWHPDHGGDVDKMQKLNQAREAALKEMKV